ncbi:MAG: hypothetical protein WAU72_00915 [Acidimicrobiia bacterium]
MAEEYLEHPEFDEVASIYHRSYLDAEEQSVSDAEERNIRRTSNFMSDDRACRIASYMDQSENFEVAEKHRERSQIIFNHKPTNSTFWWVSKTTIETSDEFVQFEPELFETNELTLIDSEKYLRPALAYRYDNQSLILHLWKYIIEQRGKGRDKKFFVLQEPVYLGGWPATIPPPPDDSWQNGEDDEREEGVA